MKVYNYIEWVKVEVKWMFTPNKCQHRELVNLLPELYLHSEAKIL